ncbi:MAG: hypothetical protein ACON5G_16950 [Pirellulaceae bacterium]
MTEQFNPYLQYLGLNTAPKKQTYYELLGVSPDETDEAAIAAGRDDALSKVRGFKPGQNARTWAAILDEISEAFAVLTISERRDAYDKELASGVLPQVLELFDLLGPIESVKVTDLHKESTPLSDGGENTVPIEQSLAEQLVPSHLGAGATVPLQVTQPIAAPVATPVVPNTPSIPIAEEVPLAVHAGVPTGGIEVPDSKLGNGGSTFSLDNSSSSGKSRARRRRKQTKVHSGFPMPLVAIMCLLLVGIVVTLVVTNSGGPEVALKSANNTPLSNTSNDRGNENVEVAERPEKIEPEQDPESPQRKPMPKDPGTGVNPLSPLPKDFGEPEEAPMSEEMPEVAPESPEPEPESPEPKPEPLTAEEKAKLREVLTLARLALAERNLDITAEQLAVASTIAREGEASSAYQRLKLMHELVHNFNRLASEAMDSYESGSEINVGSSTKAVVVEVTPDELTVKVAGVVRSAPRNKLSVGLAMGIADTNFNDPLMVPFLKAAYLVTLKSDRYVKQAREMWQSGNYAGAKIPADAFEDFLSDNYEFE